MEWKWFIRALWVMLACIFVTYSLGFGGRDSTDSRWDKKRSGLALYNDYGTGCEYIKGGLFGGISPRLNEDGSHKCDGIKTHND